MDHRSKVLQQAHFFRRQGWPVVSVPEGKKGPRTKNWPEQRLKLRDIENAFGHTDNIGVLLGAASGLVDIDLDCAESISLAPSFLPATGRIHGRKSKPASHWWYLPDEVLAPQKFLDIDGRVLLELRSTGQQTIIPPSVHPSGERFKWKMTGEPAHVRAEGLSKATRHLAAASLIARHWSQEGSRHELTLALGGCLLRSSWPLEEVEQFITATAFASADEEWKARHKNVKSTLNRLSSGEPTTGIPRLASLLGDDVVSKLLEWLAISPSVDRATIQNTQVIWPEQPKPAAFSGFAGEFVSLIEPHSEADRVALLSQFLVGFGNAIGRGPYFQIEGDQHRTNLFVVLVGSTSKSRKGSALSWVMRVLEKTDTSWASNCALSGLSSGEGVIWAVRDRTVSKDGERVLDEGVEDKRLLAVEPEIAQQLKLINRESNILSSVIRQAWDGGNLRTLTKNSPAQATGAHISIIGHITAQELHRHLSSTELGNGFANRFLWLCVRRSKVLPEGGKLGEKELQHIMKELAARVEWARQVRRMRRSPKARRLWADVYEELSAGTAGLLGAVTSRAEAQVVRLSMLYALLDSSPVIRTKHLHAALAVWEFAAESAKFVFGESLGDPLADEILKILRTNAAGLTRTEISNSFARHQRSSDIGRALVVLAQSGLASCRPEPTGGRPDERWFVLTKGAKNAKEA